MSIAYLVDDRLGATATRGEVDGDAVLRRRRSRTPDRPRRSHGHHGHDRDDSPHLGFSVRPPQADLNASKFEHFELSCQLPVKKA